MGLADIVRSGVAIAKDVTSDLQVNITHEAWISNDAYGGPTYAAATTLPAIVEREQRLIRDMNGEEIMSRTKITILQPITANGSTGRREPIDPRDRIIPSGDITGPILSVEGIVDPNTNAPYLYIVRLGDVR